MSKNKICNICKTTVDTSKEHIKISQYNKKGILDNKSYYHIICFRDRIVNKQGTRKLQEKCNKVLNQFQEKFKEQFA